MDHFLDWMQKHRDAQNYATRKTYGSAGRTEAHPPCIVAGCRLRPSSLLERLATPEEVAAMVVSVCSPRASTTNGAALRVGGVVRSIV
jgi:NAD(P)-dependent dehydrogenase (short-subunit alcohol dehydrogenase family)